MHVLTCLLLCCPFNLLVYFNDVCVGGVCCRKEAVAGSTTQNLYIATLGVLAPYRHLGLGKESKNRHGLSYSQERITQDRLSIGFANMKNYDRYFHPGSKLLNHILETATEGSTTPKVGKIYLHVQFGNEEALQFYKKHGFEMVEKCENYYPQFEVKDAYKLEKVLVPSN